MGNKPYEDIPGTIVFDGDMARLGYWVNQFCMSLMAAENRTAFLADEETYLDAWQLTDEQRQAILDRDYNALLSLGGNVYFFSKLFFTDQQSFEEGAASMAGVPREEYRAMMINGGRSIQGNRYKSEWSNPKEES